ncbi:MAG: tRNA uridine(34) 5-carboxymethylaminomethyl modification radical SAM/GNAT enzyme Elp3 [Nanoarchaeota archaeon]|nr:tRNA uridine(34) 5-carboxymethylaminomethyl modification radical SAM/GNAT enzyme Elp3 [Nanoarchaeota archaeon]
MKLPEKGEVRKPTKTIAGVTPIAVMVRPRKCAHGTCSYCPIYDLPQSYTPASPPVLRAKRCKYKSYEQIQSRLKAFGLMHHPTDKIEIIILGGTFLSYSLAYQKKFVKGIYDSLNGKVSKDLERAKKLNEKSKHRCVALCVETRPDFAGQKEIKNLLNFGCTRVELGVQIIDDEIYKEVNRGHTVQDVIDATKNLKDAGFKVGYHIMPGLPKSNPKKDLILFKKIFSNENFKPDQLKIYPTQVMKNSKLEKDFIAGKYKPYTLAQTEKLLLKMFEIIPEYCRAMRVMRQFSPEYIIAGTTRISLRKDIDEILRKNKTPIKEIRFREIGFALQQHKKISSKYKIKVLEYSASGGKEFFIQAVNKDNILFGLLRLRIPKETKLKQLKNCVLIREIHVYGQSLEIGARALKIGQHKGIGKQLMQTAEEIVKNLEDKNIKKIAVISGVGVRDYYRKIGYKLKQEYMIKGI